MSTESKASVTSSPAHLWEFDPNQRDAWNRRYAENPSL
jgi:hypothetical protein